MRRSNASLALYLSLVFVSGLAVGALGHRYFEENPVVAKASPRKLSPEEYRRAYIAEMRTRLKLSEEQAQRLEVILDETRNKFRELRERDRSRPEIKAIQDEQVSRINAILDPAQQAEYERMRIEREKQRHAEAEKRRSHEAPPSK